MKRFNSFLIVSGVSSLVLAYFTVKQYRKRLKYKLIPGPPTNGFNFILTSSRNFYNFFSI